MTHSLTLFRKLSYQTQVYMVNAKSTDDTNFTTTHSQPANSWYRTDLPHFPSHFRWWVRDTVMLRIVVWKLFISSNDSKKNAKNMTNNISLYLYKDI